MAETLYVQVSFLEQLGLDYIAEREILEGLFQRYEANPVFKDAKIGKTYIKESLDMLARRDTGISSLLPWRLDEKHNERLDAISELISRPAHLATNGIFVPDNLLTGGLVWGTMISTVLYFGMQSLNSLGPIPQISYDALVEVSAMGGLIAGPLIALKASSHRFYDKIPTQEAEYLDRKIIEFYQ